MRHLIGIAVLFCAFPIAAEFSPPNSQGVAFSHMHVVVEDLELHKRLWPDLFGAELVEKEGFTAVRVTDALIFFRNAEPTATSVETAIDHFGLNIRDLEEVLSKWQALGYEADSEGTSASGSATAIITMPGGIRLNLTEVPDQSASSAMGHVQYVTPTNDEVMAWYVEHFGFTTASQTDGSQVLLVPGAQLHFKDTDKARLPTDGAAIDHVGFEVQEWDAFIEKLNAAEIQFEFGPVYIESLDLWVAFFNDPAGVLVEISNGLDVF